MIRMDEHTSVFTFFGAADVPLYVSITDSLSNQLSQRYSRRMWWRSARRIEITHWPTIDEAGREAERLILEHRPDFNFFKFGALDRVPARPENDANIVSPNRFPPNDPTSVYLIFDRDDVSLYVGMTRTLPSRLSEHHRKQPWWNHVARVELEHWTSRETAAEREAELLVSLAPLHCHAPIELLMDSDPRRCMAISARTRRRCGNPAHAEPGLCVVHQGISQAHLRTIFDK